MQVEVCRVEEYGKQKKKGKKAASPESESGAESEAVFSLTDQVSPSQIIPKNESDEEIVITKPRSPKKQVALDGFFVKRQDDDLVIVHDVAPRKRGQAGVIELDTEESRKRRRKSTGSATPQRSTTPVRRKKAVPESADKTRRR